MIRKYKFTKAKKEPANYGTIQFIVDTVAPIKRKDLVVFIDDNNNRFAVVSNKCIIPVLKDCDVSEEHILQHDFVIVPTEFTKWDNQPEIK